jgi:O-antigen/teichoic acid export membrane protein
MLKNIIGTVGSRYFVALLGFLVIIINSKALGREGMGIVGLIYTSANFAVIFNGILCGNTIVYFVNRYNLRMIFYTAYIFALIGSVVITAILAVLGMIPDGYAVWVFTLAALMSLFNANTMILLGKDKVMGFNLSFIIQGVTSFVLLLILYFIAGMKSVEGYLTGLLTAYLAACVYSFVLSARYLAKSQNVVAKSYFSVIREMFVYGLWGSVDNLAEGLASRLNYYIIRFAGGYANVGLLDAGTKISESVGHISNSISYLEYNSVSKTTDIAEQKIVTIRLFKLSYCALAAVMAVIVCIPEWLITEYLLTEEFAGIQKVIHGLSFGIVAYGSNRILSHYFIGSGNIRYSACCSCIGLLVLLAAGFFIIPVYGVFGAALTSSIAFVCMLIFSLSVFMRQTKTGFKELIPSKGDYKLLREKIHLLKCKSAKSRKQSQS